MSEVRLLAPEGRRSRRQRGSEGEGMARDEGEEHKRAKIGTKDKKKQTIFFFQGITTCGYVAKTGRN